MPSPVDTEASAANARIAKVTQWYRANGRDLPWRRPGCSPWGVLVSEVMLQQTPVSRVLPVWERWMERWPTPEALAAASQADAVRAWGRLGYPRRAKMLWECASVLVERHGGRVPDVEADLRSLPGVGEYTAAAVVAFAFGQRSVVVDTNVRRVIARAWRGQAVAAPSYTSSERALAGTIVPKDAGAAVVWSVAAMELGALLCTARAPQCDDCPIAGECEWLSAGRPAAVEAERRVQPWQGSDRQVRGRIMALLRDAAGPAEVMGCVELADLETEQVRRCLDSLVIDGLVSLADAATERYILA